VGLSMKKMHENNKLEENCGSMTAQFFPGETIEA